MSGHTPGPWDYGTDGFEWGLGVFAGERCVCRMDWPETTEGSHEANARLIAAAPELLEACEAAREAFDAWSIERAYLTLHEAIAKTERRE